MDDLLATDFRSFDATHRATDLQHRSPDTLNADRILTLGSLYNHDNPSHNFGPVMPTTATPAQEHQARWDEIASDPSLRDLPYKVETNHRGQIVLSPQTNRHSVVQKALQNLLDEYAPEGRTPPEFAIATSEGVKVPDVIWMSPQRWEEMQRTGDPSTLAPEICAEVLSSSNTAEEIEEKRALYREAGAEEVWTVDRENQLHFFGDEELDRSRLAPKCPNQIPKL